MDSVCRKNIPVTLLGLGNKACTEAVNRCVQRLGCRVSDRGLADLDSAGAPPVDGVAVLVLGQLPQAARQSAVRLLARLQAQPSLGIFSAEHNAWDPDLLQRCSEFSIWPCSEQEIGARLDRLWGAVRPATVGSGDLAETLLELNLVGRAPAFVESLERVRRFADCDAPVLIEGETGTGKELFARAFHYLSPRRDYPFVPVNCGALPDHLLENELFGHERGAYTDASGSYAGLVAQADKGTLFLDEVEALTARAQIVLLRFLQAQDYRPLGGTRVRRGNVRIIAASNENLNQAVARGAFREDLLFRMDVLRVPVPPLRERPEDIELLAEHFMQEFRDRYDRPTRRLQRGALDWMRDYDWPGNVRQLENLLHRAFMLSESDEVRLWPGACGQRQASGASEAPAPDLHDIDFRRAKAQAVARFEHAYLQALMARAQGNVSLAARLAGKERSALGKLLKKHQIKRSRFS